MASLNDLMKFYQMLLSGNLGMFTGTADPVALMQEQEAMQSGTPLAESYLSSSNEDVKRVFSGLVSGQLDPISAKNELASVFGAGADTAPLYKAVDDVMAELGKSKATKKPTSAAAKGYLPSPSETYFDPQYMQNPDLIPLLPKAQKAIGELDTKLALLKKMVPAAKGTVSGKARQRTDFTSIDPELGKQFNALAPSEQQIVLSRLKDTTQGIESTRNKYFQENLGNLQKSGRTPFNDALVKRAMALAGFLGQTK